MTARDQLTAPKTPAAPDSLSTPEHERREQKRARRRLEQHRRLRTGLALGLTALAALAATTAALPVQETGTAEAAPASALTGLVALAQSSAIPGAAAADAGGSDMDGAVRADGPAKPQEPGQAAAGHGAGGHGAGQAAAQPAGQQPAAAAEAASGAAPQQDAQDRPAQTKATQDSAPQAAQQDARAGQVQADAARKAAEAEAARKAAQEKAAQAEAAQKAAQQKAAAAGKPVNNPAAAKAYASRELRSYGWDASQMPCLDRLWKRESDWLTSATNPSSGAYGIVQSLPGDKMATAGPDWRTNYETQIDWGLDYIDGRYGSPCSALQFHYANNWY
ncbi:aggregation-promoting factor C-terminal-like domain-containing protein [Arthrobacter mobilis]|uniref:Transglycosylase SLT domain-containing protein n=1 Tax=Arthrobacter mobilis TaxID=2724944 RepID=A0A7X6HFA5_9MICC|nr:hypothetical protein [Arthrobacter mobilis]NKX56097.1 hypothetical protein [Arthrobacter mobilis]